MRMQYYDIHNLLRGTTSVIEDKSKLEWVKLKPSMKSVAYPGGVQREKVVKLLK